MNIEKNRQEYIEQGYTGVTATAKVCQDVILDKIAKSPYFKNITIKVGVIMQSLSNNTCRATRDIDVDFIKYSLNDDSIVEFIG